MKNKLLILITLSLATITPLSFADEPSPSASEGVPAVTVKPALSGQKSVGDPAKGAPYEQISATGSGSVQNVPLERAKGEKLATAMGYYSRSRALLIAAIREFDKGYALVDPNALLDSRMWRESVMDRADELGRVLDPQPRATKGGIRFGSETQGIGDTRK